MQRAYNLVKKDDKWKIKNNHEIDGLLNHENIVRFVKAQRIHGYVI